MRVLTRRKVYMNERRPRILIVDDDDVIRNILDELLSKLYDCTISNSAADALEILASESFDLILSDINMPEMTGLEMMPYLTNLAPESIVDRKKSVGGKRKEEDWVGGVFII